MIRYYLDTHIPKAVAEQLRLRGIDVVRCEEVGLAEADDTEHLEYAAAQERTLVSHDADFRTVHSVWGARFGARGHYCLQPTLSGRYWQVGAGAIRVLRVDSAGSGDTSGDIFSTLIEVTE